MLYVLLCNVKSGILLCYSIDDDLMMKVLLMNESILMSFIFFLDLQVSVNLSHDNVLQCRFFIFSLYEQSKPVFYHMIRFLCLNLCC